MTILAETDSIATVCTETFSKMTMNDMLAKPTTSPAIIIRQLQQTPFQVITRCQVSKIIIIIIYITFVPITWCRVSNRDVCTRILKCCSNKIRRACSIDSEKYTTSQIEIMEENHSWRCTRPHHWKTGNESWVKIVYLQGRYSLCL